MGFNASDTFSAFEESTYNATINSGILTLDFHQGQYAKVLLTENVTGINILNAPEAGTVGNMTVELTQDATGSSTFAGAFLTDSGAGVGVSAAANSLSLIALLTTDGGATYLGMSAGKAYAQ